MNVIRRIKTDIVYYNKENSYRQGVVRPEIVESWKRIKGLCLDPKKCRLERD
jgi:hypothetical protein